MATTSMWAVRTRLDHLVEYVSNKEKTTLISTVIDYTTNAEKTMERQFVSCINCMQNNPYTSMVQTKKLFHDEKEILCYHGYQSFSEGEVTPEQAHGIGVALANELWGERFEVIVTTHLNTDNVHNHFLINATSCIDGKRYCNTKHDRYLMMNASDSLCKQHGLTVVDKQMKQSQSRSQYWHETTLRQKIKNDVDTILRTSYTLTQFYNQLEFEGYEIKQSNTNVSLRHPLHERFIRLSSLGDDYNKEDICKVILQNKPHQPNEEDAYKKIGFDIKPYYEKYKVNKLTGLQKFYLHYQYKLGILPKVRNTKPKYSKELRNAIRRMDELSNQTTLLCKQNINTIEELNQYQAPLQKQLDELTYKRSQCYYKIRRCKTFIDKEPLKEEAKSYTPMIRELRKQIKLCEGIKIRSIEIQAINYELQKQVKNR